MSAHGDEMDTMPKMSNDTESCSPKLDDIVFKGDMLHAVQLCIPIPEDAAVDQDSPMSDDIFNEGDRLCTKLLCIPIPKDVVVERNFLDKKPFCIPISEDLLDPIAEDCTLSSTTVSTLTTRSSSVGSQSRLPSSDHESSHTETSSKHGTPVHEVSSTESSSKPVSHARQVSSTGSSSGSASSFCHISLTGSPHRAAPLSKRPPPVNKILWGNIRPHGLESKIGSGFKSPPKTRVLGSGHSDYGYGTVINTTRKVFEEAMQCGDDAFNKGLYKEALQEYDKAVHMRPRNIIWRIVRADTLVCLGRFAEAFNEYHEAYRLDPDNGRLHHRLSLFHLRLGVVDIADLHMIKASPECKEDLSAKIAKVKGHLIGGGNARKDDNWMDALKEVDAMIAAGADSSQSILAFRAEMFFRLNRLDQAEETITEALMLESKLPSLVKFLGMSPKAYVSAVHAQIEMALGRFENAVTIADRAYRIDQFNDEISAIQTNVRLASAARITGNKHYRSGDYLKACEEYKVGLKYTKFNVSLLSNLAACHWQLERWENCIEICNQVLQIQPDNPKALLRRADSYAKMTSAL